MNLFGKKKEPPAMPAPPPTAPPKDSTKAAMEKVNDTLETISKREDHVQRKMDNELKQAKDFNAKGKKREALQCIKRKKMYEKQLESLSNTKMTLENQKLTMEQMKINAGMLEAQKLAAQAMQEETKKMGGVDKVEEIMDQVEDGLQDAAEIQDALGRQVDMPGVDADEDDLLAELEGLEEDALAADLGTVDLGADAAVDMPSTPISLPAAGQKKVMTDEERELAELEASMAM
mmetsp:Transcript_713/g.1917  ORF Transcript_713/g.1917 Transcript_713/m.1917 type:complete len:233 (+) Transcript_713:151-849(+)